MDKHPTFAQRLRELDAILQRFGQPLGAKLSEISDTDTILTKPDGREWTFEAARDAISIYRNTEEPDGLSALDQVVLSESCQTLALALGKFCLGDPKNLEQSIAQLRSVFQDEVLLVKLATIDAGYIFHSIQIHAASKATEYNGAPFVTQHAKERARMIAEERDLRNIYGGFYPERTFPGVIVPDGLDRTN